MVAEEAHKLLEDLFEKAKAEGSIQYLYTLVRVDGITSYPDPILKLNTELQSNPAPASGGLC